MGLEETNVAKAKKRPAEDDDGGGGGGTDSDEGEHNGDNNADDGEEGGEFSHLRREKRLAMNRDSARARRKRKKILLETLEQQVADLAERNQRLQSTKETLTAKVRQLESDLSVARSTIAMLNSQPNNSGMGAAVRDAASSQDAVLRMYSGAQPHRMMPDQTQAQLLAEETLLRRNAALEFHAFQAGRDSAALEAYRQQLAAAPSGMNPATIQNTLAMPPDRGLEGTRVNEIFPGLPTTAHYSTTEAAPSPNQMISELLKQRAAAKYKGKS